MPRPKNTDARRAQIVEGFLRILAERGYRGATISDTARAAGLTPGLLHYHFKSKLEILTALLARLERTLLERYERFLGRGAAPLGRVQAMVKAHLALTEDYDPAVVRCWVNIMAEAQLQSEVGELYRELLERQLDFFSSAAAECLGRRRGVKARAREIGCILLSTIIGFFQIALTTPERIPRGSAVVSVSRLAATLLEPSLPERVTG